MDKKVLAGITIGAVVSAAAVVALLHTKKGKEVAHDTKETAEDIWDDVAEIVESTVKELRERVKKK